VPENLQKQRAAILMEKKKRMETLRANSKKMYSHKSPLLPFSIKFTNIVTPLNLKERLP